MENILTEAVYIDEKNTSTAKKPAWKFDPWLLLYPVGVVRIWRKKLSIWIKLPYTVLLLPIFLITTIYIGILLFAAFLPPLDKTVGKRADKTIYNPAGNYGVIFVKSRTETNNAYELVHVELEPNGGNDWHYHKSFSEQFTVIEGRVRIGHNGSEIILNKGETTVADKKTMHYFKNALNEKSVLEVKITPAAGMEKTLRVAYGLINDGLLKNDMTENPWHMCLLLGYSESYLPVMPGWFQEPLISSLAKIAQWKGEDKALYKYFK